MPDRHSGLSGARVAAALLALLAACATSANSSEHGPSFGDDGGADATSDGAPVTDAPSGPDASTDAAAPQPEGSTSSDGGTTPDSALTQDSSTSDTGSPPGDAGCSSTAALLAMGSGGVVEAVMQGGTWAAASSASPGGVAAPASPAIVAFGGGYLGAYVTSSSQLDGTVYASAWTSPAALGSQAAQGTPALAVTGSMAHAVYWGGMGNGLYYSDDYAGSWSAMSTKVQGDGGQSFGSSAPAAAGVGSSVVAVQSGSNGTLYDQIWTGGVWQDASSHPGTAVVPTIAPAIVALQGGSADALVVYVRSTNNDDHLEYTTRSSGAWSTPAEVYDQGGNSAYTGYTPSVAALPGGGAVVAWLGGNNMPYASIYAAGSGWSAPAQIAARTLVSAPAIAQGVCGAQVMAAFVETSGGQVDVSTLAGVTWSSPTSIAQATSMQSVAIASSP
jgi:hypothetical protein